MLGLYFIGTVHGEKFNSVVEFCSKLDAPASAPGDKKPAGITGVCPHVRQNIFTDSRWGD